jgi:3-hydroxybutyryl-CoA dehydrogenase
MKLDNVNHIAIIGTGMIGASMAVLFTGNGYKTTMLAINDAESKKGQKTYDEYYQDLISKGLVTPAQAAACGKLLSITQNYEDIKDTDFIFECVVEQIKVKYEVFKEIEKYCKKFKALASSTSAISADDLAEGLINKDRLACAHPWNPPHLVPCVEVLRSKYTSDEAVNLIINLLESVGREVVVMLKSAPGFIANRLQHALVREAVYMVEQGIATPEDIDKSLRTSFAPRYTSIGLFEHQDYAGLDMVSSIHEYLYPSLCNECKTQDYIKTRYESGNLGYKTGKGIYDWSKKNTEEFKKRASEPYLKFFNWNLPKVE